MESIFCTCKTHCATYNHETGTYHGGRFVNKITAFRHRRDENRSAAPNGFTHHVASISPNIPGLELFDSRDDAPIFPSQIAALPVEVATLQGEIGDRISWAATTRPLVFAIDPVPDVDFENPLVPSQYIPNHGPQALHPSNHNNIAFIENESRLYEILGSLEMDALAVNREVLDGLIDKVYGGLYRMMEHKRCEWERQRSRTRAIVKGYTVINTG
jgi:hypothetical protein